ncbi:dTDP-4-dehydrorhamnose reductase [Haloprofundus halophilus]|uniref:dTDP-4-dehydrorhamnose reductase n=1 Tax=Haloprofundus halophilus TaxID=2283527 RepID=UPI000E438138|nr:dTDP-4-dehydrorhamnose reductase [Haloprofundus halophilus]
MTVLVLGAGGLLGSSVTAEAMDRGRAVVAAFHSQAPEFETELVQYDVTDTEDFIGLLVEYEPDVVVNCAAMTDVDGCEARPERAREVNGRAPGRLAECAADHDVDFVHVSTDYVFNGRASQSYEEASGTNPIQAYGRSKRLGEQRVQESHSEALVVRLSFVYGQRGDSGRLEGFPSWVREQLDAGDSLPLFADQHVTPSRAGHVAETIFDLLSLDASGVVHVASSSCVSPYEIGLTMADIVGESTEKISKSALADVERDAERPRHTCLDVKKVESLLDRPQPTLEEDLRAIL